MPITVTCPGCDKPHRVADGLAGREFSCDYCQATLRIPEAASLGEQLPMRERRIPIFATMAILGLAALFAILCSIQAIDAKPWVKFQSKQGAYEIEMPAPPDPTSKAPNTVINPRQWKGTDGLTSPFDGAHYLVAHRGAGLRVVVGQMHNPEPELGVLIENAIAEIESVRGVTVRRCEKATVYGCPAQDLVVVRGHVKESIRIVATELQVFAISASGDIQGSEGRYIRHFFDSFNIANNPALELPKTREYSVKQIEEAQRAFLKRQEDERIAAAKRPEEQRLAAAKREEEAKQKLQEAFEAERREFESGKYAYKGPPVPDPNTLPGLTLHLPLDDGPEVVNRVSKRIVGKWVGRVSLVKGVRGNAIIIRDLQSHIELDKALGAVRFDADTSFTIAGWYRGRRQRAAFAAYDTTRPGLTRMTLSFGSEGRVSGHLNNRSVLQEGLPGPEKKESEITLDDWHHYALVRSATTKGEKIELFLDGTPCGTSTHESRSTLKAVTTFRLGSQVYDRLVIDDFCIFKRDLSEAELKYLAGRGARPKH